MPLLAVPLHKFFIPESCSSVRLNCNDNEIQFIGKRLTPPGGRLNIKMSYQYRDPHVKDKTATTVLSLTMESPYLDDGLYIETGTCCLSRLSTWSWKVSRPRRVPGHWPCSASPSASRISSPRWWATTWRGAWSTSTSLLLPLCLSSASSGRSLMSPTVSSASSALVSTWWESHSRLLCWIYFRKRKNLLLSIISQHGDDACSWNSSTSKTMTSVSHISNTMAADDITTQRAKTWVTRVLI